jgi:NADH:ubiquinone oxidoreductase subunit 3 (subunit A)
MTSVLLTPPIAFIIFLVLSLALSALGRWLAGHNEASELKSTIVSGGEVPPTIAGAPGYQPFFVIALFFAILHLGVLMLGSGSPSWMSIAYTSGLILILVAIVLG